MAKPKVKVTYREVDIGRPAVFLLPEKKAQKKLRDRILKYLRSAFGGATYAQAKTGEWVDKRGLTIKEGQWEFEISFLGKDRVPSLFQYLAELAYELGEECIYVKCGEETRLIYPVVQVERDK